MQHDATRYNTMHHDASQCNRMLDDTTRCNLHGSSLWEVAASSSTRRSNYSSRMSRCRAPSAFAPSALPHVAVPLRPHPPALPHSARLSRHAPMHRESALLPHPPRAGTRSPDYQGDEISRSARRMPLTDLLAFAFANKKRKATGPFVRQPLSGLLRPLPSVRPCYMCTGTGLTPTSHLHQDRAHPHLTPAPGPGSPPPHICAGTRVST